MKNRKRGRERVEVASDFNCLPLWAVVSFIRDRASIIAMPPTYIFLLYAFILVFLLLDWLVNIIFILVFTLRMCFVCGGGGGG